MKKAIINYNYQYPTTTMKFTLIALATTAVLAAPQPQPQPQLLGNNGLVGRLLSKEDLLNLSLHTVVGGLGNILAQL
ncbi:hypothetical protein CONCODRAFT_12812 [Conidiobolus coronatus NRRL 28638]|uniref:Uncharacterized protein n=1 Tax=Conidiobolus coronatus (strain ATCC 28846 / CBS 209.66 / NRRL 28638) TaxID=796925 RepID=A0A137NS31_CONC2|nr:hypothetical protein CONCODRAFT_12812 [Conidiobolus coronatus NRRL 28638]|eukprot:KXN65565.1 hypothetical protein CONCODRAFT_12812 [Conidiobolus coronatus NRRL 28638]